MARWFRCDVCHHVYSCQQLEVNEKVCAVCPQCGIPETTATLMKNHHVSCLWHLTHVNNITNILQHGILNHYEARGRKTDLIDISDPEAQKWRERRDPYYNRRVHDYAPLYINPRNPMLYVRKHLQNELCLIEVSLATLIEGNYLLTDGNAASRDTLFFNSMNDFASLPWDVLSSNYWGDFPDGKRKRCAEALIYPRVEPKHLGVIHCYSSQTLNYLANCWHKAILSPNLFF